PVYGYEILVNEHNVRDELQLDVARHHHEKLTGTGYPDKLKGDEVSVYARISAIADIFDALTTRRSYKNAFRSFDALNLMKTQMCNEIDMGIFKKFIILLGKKEENI
ncbi:MAG: HD domain-containing phosphohydrolase, partial [Candidatus Methanomethylicaceae archaeon]